MLPTKHRGSLGAAVIAGDGASRSCKRDDAKVQNVPEVFDPHSFQGCLAQ